MEISKQSLKDWQVTVNGSHFAWIRKVPLGYEVSVKNWIGPAYFEPSFKTAKEFCKAAAA